MKIIATVLIAAALVCSFSGQAMADFEEGHLIRIVYGGTKEIATDLGAGWDLSTPYAGTHIFNTNNISLTDLGVSDWSSVKVAYFITDSMNYTAWTSGPESGQSSARGLADTLYYNTGFVTAMNAMTGLAQNVYNQSEPRSYVSNVFPAGSFAGFLKVYNGEASLAALNTPGGSVDQWLYYYADADASAPGVQVIKLTTKADGTTEINAADGYPEPPQIDPISLDRPIEGQMVDASSLYNAMPFSWISRQEFSRFEIQFSTDNFAGIAVKIKKRGDATDAVIASALWKKIMKLPGMNSGTLYWRVAGFRHDRSVVYSPISSFIVKSPEAVSSPQISHMSKTALPPPTLSWGNNNNVKFKVWFGNDSDFTKIGIRKKVLTFTIKNPLDNDGAITRVLTAGQWNAIRQVVRNVTGETVYWYVASWDGINRHTKSEVMSFILAE